MPEKTTDYNLMQREYVNCTGTDGSTFDGEAYMVPVLIPVEEVPELLAQYDPNSGTSPLVAVARPLARVILDALKKYTEEG